MGGTRARRFPACKPGDRPRATGRRCSRRAGAGLSNLALSRGACAVCHELFRRAGTRAGREERALPSVRPWATLALVTAALHAPPAAAQDDADGVVITATRFPERALGTAIGTRVITAADIARSAARTLPEIIGQLGGVHIRDASGSPNQQLDLRGFGITGDQNTLVLLDGVRLSPIDLSSPNLSSIPLEAIERIEILAGGGGVAYGGGTTGGTINIVTRGVQPGTQSGSVFAGGGSLATYDLRGNASASDDRLGLAMYANAYKTNNYRDNNRFDQLNVLGDLRYALDRGSLSL